nr:integrase, catalytic region, zinc finger, CCHC-type, peptidase aspartic, catalytic [Tanacetum cinerariifolium]
MANLSEDIQCASSDTRPPMLDRTEFASWQQRIRLYCQGKENEVSHPHHHKKRCPVHLQEIIAALRLKLLHSLEPGLATSCLCSIRSFVVTLLLLHPMDSSPDLYYVAPEHSEPQLCYLVLWLGSLYWMKFRVDCLFEVGRFCMIG